ncbi:MAG: hypothetical protein EOO01_34380, partial [Chitinophagaceae bacterium]
MLKTYGLKLKTTNDGFDIYFNSGIKPADLADIVKPMSGQGYFEFDIKSIDSNFVFFTELPADGLWQMNFESKDSLNTREDLSVV